MTYSSPSLKPKSNAEGNPNLTTRILQPSPSTPGEWQGSTGEKYHGEFVRSKRHGRGEINQNPESNPQPNLDPDPDAHIHPKPALNPYLKVK